MKLLEQKVVFLITSLALGGAETQLYYLATSLKQRGWDVKVVSMCAPQAFAKELHDNGILVYSLDIPKGVLDWKALFRLVRILKQEKPSILHGHMVHANLLARLVRLFVPIPVVVCTAHNICEGGRHRNEWYRLTDFLCDMTTQVSEAGLTRYVEERMVDPQKAVFLPNGVNTAVFKKDPISRQRGRAALNVNHDFVWLAAGRFEEAKDYPNMIHAFASLFRKDPRNILLIVGEGSLRPQMETLANELGVGHRIKFLELQKNMPGMMNVADAYVMASAWEGMPMVLLEAAACELPIVATDVGGNREVVLDGKTGFIVSAKKPEDLARSMETLTAMSEDRRLFMGQEGRRYIKEKYDLNFVTGAWEDLYYRLLDKKKSHDKR